MKHIKTYTESSENYETMHFIDFIDLAKRRNLKSLEFNDKEIDYLMNMFPGKKVVLLWDSISIHKDNRYPRLFISICKYTDEWYVLPTIYVNNSIWTGVTNVYLCDGFEGLVECLKDVNNINI